MKKILICLLILALGASIIYSLGLTGAIKKRVKTVEQQVIEVQSPVGPQGPLVPLVREGGELLLVSRSQRGGTRGSHRAGLPGSDLKKSDPGGGVSRGQRGYRAAPRGPHSPGCRGHRWQRWQGSQDGARGGAKCARKANATSRSQGSWSCGGLHLGASAGSLRAPSFRAQPRW